MPFTEISPVRLDYICRLIKSRSGIVLDESKKYLLVSRLGRVAKINGFESLDEFATRLEIDQDEDLQNQCVLALATHETSFFRDESYYSMLRTQILPMLANRRLDKRKIRIWSCACSTGQEPYSVSMLLEENSMFASFDKEIIATDLSQNIIDYAKAGIYNQFEMGRGLNDYYKNKYFTEQSDGWHVKAQVRKNIHFSALNLLDSTYLIDRVDLILIRNVLFYFDEKTKQHVINALQKKLVKDGVLILGSSETLLTMASKLVPVKSGNSFYYQFY